MDKTKMNANAVANAATELDKAKISKRAESAMMSVSASTNVWSDPRRDLKLDVNKEDYNDNVNLCRFFYKTEPLVHTVINKLVEIAVNDIIISKRGLSENEFRVFLALKPRLLEFSETIAQELLVSGLAVPEIGYGPVEKDEIFELGIKKYSKLIFPISMWVRDSNTIKMYSSLMSDQPTYFVIIPDSVVYFIKNKGKYPDGNSDQELYENLKSFYPEFVKDVNAGKKEIQIDGRLVLRRKYLPSNPYPISYIQPALEALQHKRRMRRMDYSIMDKVISAVMHIKIGSDDFPVTDSEEDRLVFSDIKNQLNFRFQSDQNLERIFQLITNHTVDISWIFPNMELLSDSTKYNGINEEILFGLGFPRILISGESAKSGTSSPEIAILSPLKTVESIRRKILKVIRDVFKTVAEENSFKVPSVVFKPLNLQTFEELISAMEKLYNMAGVSRETVGELLGVDFEEEVEKLTAEKELLNSKGLSDFGSQPYSRPTNTGDDSTNNVGNTKTDNSEKKAAKKSAKKEVTDEN